MSSTPGDVSMRVSGATTPSLSASATVTGLSVDAGSKTSVSTRSRKRPSSAAAVRSFGSNVGAFTSARISPVFASTTIAQPAAAAVRATARSTARCARCWIRRSIDSRTSAPGTPADAASPACTGRPIRSTIMSRFAPTPASAASAVRSTPSSPWPSAPTKPTSCAASPPLG